MQRAYRLQYAAYSITAGTTGLGPGFIYGRRPRQYHRLTIPFDGYVRRPLHTRPRSPSLPHPVPGFIVFEFLHPYSRPRLGTFSPSVDEGLVAPGFLSPYSFI